MPTLDAAADVMTRLGRAMSDRTRSRILLRLLDGAAHPAELALDLDLSRQNVSNHLACLRGCGLVSAEPHGRNTRYEVLDPHLVAAIRELLRVSIAVSESEPCCDGSCPVPGCCESAA
ncbi:metalloregulator ArsR/SmtB family transcription factor [Microbacterium sp. M28]|uniref:ArsR/SmtB family transcription factor n=1 Tax=Microbacterium sp. M28 TaxID=2962064 RepID=UPI0021F3F496|nr:metalloregulator ArsR/SmtB family transcription factor [Microbacterium sp. M28]UYO96393.1 metalloregulator ArsR/SmtB family transcription factor [Microbacterium sp. M28]